MRTWWNRQTRKLEVLVSRDVQVQVLLSAPYLPVVEFSDAADSKSVDTCVVWVRVPPPTTNKVYIGWVHDNIIAYLALVLLLGIIQSEEH